MNTSPMDPLDQILARSVPPAVADDPALDAAIRDLVEESRTAALLRRRSTSARRFSLFAAIVALGGAMVGGVAYGATQVISTGGDGWNELTEEAEVDALRFEWPVTLPDGTRCVNRLTGVDLSDGEIAAVESALADPARLIELDDGAVRAQFLDTYDRSSHQQEIADRATWESWIEAGYDAVKSMDATAGRGPLTDDELSVVPGSAENEVFLHTSTRIILDGMAAMGVDAFTELTPEVACEVGE